MMGSITYRKFNLQHGLRREWHGFGEDSGQQSERNSSRKSVFTTSSSELALTRKKDRRDNGIGVITALRMPFQHVGLQCYLAQPLQ
jgi:hypothetical protein